jgi:hypothetical protein
MSERMRCVVASPKTENISATALVIMAKTTMPWSVKSTVSIIGLQFSVLSEGAAALLRALLQSFATLAQSVSFHTSEKFGNRLSVPPDRHGT